MVQHAELSRKLPLISFAERNNINIRFVWYDSINSSNIWLCFGPGDNKADLLPPADTFGLASPVNSYLYELYKSLSLNGKTNYYIDFKTMGLYSVSYSKSDIITGKLFLYHIKMVDYD